MTGGRDWQEGVKLLGILGKAAIALGTLSAVLGYLTRKGGPLG